MLLGPLFTYLWGYYIYFFLTTAERKAMSIRRPKPLKIYSRVAQDSQDSPKLLQGFTSEPTKTQIPSLKMNSCRLCPNLTSNTMEVRKSATYHFITRLWCNRFNAHLSNWVQKFLGTANFKLASFRKFAIDETLKELLGWI